MKIFRRTLFGVLLASLLIGISGLVYFGPEGPDIFTVAMIGAVAGLLLWSIIFLISEPLLTRLSLITVFIFLAYIFIAAATSATD
jgi:hypothetical protein